MHAAARSRIAPPARLAHERLGEVVPKRICQPPPRVAQISSGGSCPLPACGSLTRVFHTSGTRVFAPPSPKIAFPFICPDCR
jgi:hypothetical protein